MVKLLRKYYLPGLIFGFCLVFLTACEISGKVTRDGDGVKGVTVVLSDGEQEMTTTTDRKGDYVFSDIPKGVYTVTIQAPDGYSGKAEQRVFKAIDDKDEKDVDFSMDSTTIKTISSGRIIGTRDENGIATWQGIPYAAPPVGDLRWRAPVDPDSWGDDPYMAVATGSPGPQFLHMLSDPPVKFYGELMGKEDCLYLNVWAPETEGKKPVMFWIHGGGESVGEGGIYNGKMLAETYDVVVVTINYRLGPFGWFSHEKLNADKGDEDRSGNFGTLDIIHALNWVQENIDVFGGDKDNVMVFGESAGGLNTLTMLASPLAKGLFHKAAVQSAVFDWVAEHTAWLTKTSAENYTDDPEPGLALSSSEIINKLLISKGLAADRDSAKTLLAGMTEDELESFARGLTSDELMLAYGYTEYLGGIILKPSVTRDGVVIPDMDPISLFESGEYNQVPTIVGNNRDEMKLFMMLMPEYVNNILDTVPLVLDKNDYELSAYYMSAFWREVTTDRLSAALSVNQPESIYSYRFDWDEEPNLVAVDVSLVIGAAHGMEIPFVFADPDSSVVESKELFIYTKKNKDGRYALADTMSSYWVALANYGAPGTGMPGHEQPYEWTPYTTDVSQDRLMVFDTPESGGPVMSDVMLSNDQLKQELQLEDGYNDPELKCSVYIAVFGEDDYYLNNCQE